MTREKRATDHFKKHVFNLTTVANPNVILQVMLVHKDSTIRKSVTRAIRFMSITLISLSIPTPTLSQLPDLGTAINFALFTSVGALGNTGTSIIIGNIGTHDGAITAFEPPTTVVGNIELANTATAQCLLDVQAAYNEIVVMTPTEIGHSPAFGSGETLLNGIYNIGGAGSVLGDLTLDAEGDTNAIFIFQFGGAFDSAASSAVLLTNGAKACNVFWIAEGTMSLATLTEMKGTMISNNGAISMAASTVLYGRMLTTGGAANIYDGAILLPCIGVTLPINMLSFTGHCEEQNKILEWSTAEEINNDYFSLERSTNGTSWQTVGEITGAGNSSAQIDYTLTDKSYTNEMTYYRLKQTDFNGNFKYENIISIDKCKNIGTNYFTIYPNPSDERFNLFYSGNTSEINSITIINAVGQSIYRVMNYQSTFDISHMDPGFYSMKIQYNSMSISLKFIIAS